MGIMSWNGRIKGIVKYKDEQPTQTFKENQIHEDKTKTTQTTTLENNKGGEWKLIRRTEVLFCFVFGIGVNGIFKVIWEDINQI